MDQLMVGPKPGQSFPIAPEPGLYLIWGNTGAKLYHTANILGVRGSILANMP